MDPMPERESDAARDLKSAAKLENHRPGEEQNAASIRPANHIVSDSLSVRSNSAATMHAPAAEQGSFAEAAADAIALAVGRGALVVSSFCAASDAEAITGVRRRARRSKRPASPHSAKPSTQRSRCSRRLRRVAVVASMPATSLFGCCANESVQRLCRGHF